MEVKYIETKDHEKLLNKVNIFNNLCCNDKIVFENKWDFKFVSFNENLSVTIKNSLEKFTILISDERLSCEVIEVIKKLTT